MPVKWCDVVTCGCIFAYRPILYILMYLRNYVRHRLDTEPDGVGLKFPPHRLASGVGGLRASHEISLDPSMAGGGQVQGRRSNAP